MNKDDDSVKTLPRRSFIKGAGGIVAAGALIGAGGVASKAFAATNTPAGDPDIYDVIVIGGGFAGVTAARELREAGKSVLLIEARNRLGGRTFTSVFKDEQVELGGTWVHWGQPHVWAEILRYGLTLKESPGAAPDTASWLADGKLKQGTALESFEIMGRAYQKYVNVDEQMGRTVFPRPYDPLFTDNWKKYDAVSLTDRMKQVDLNAEERDVLNSLLTICCHNDPAQGGFLDMLKWNANAYYDVGVLWDMCARYKIKEGTHALIQAMVDAAKPDVLLGMPVQEVHQNATGVQVKAADGKAYKAKAAVVALPLNVLTDVAFSPAISSVKLDSSREGHTGKGAKFYVRIKQKIGRWSGSAPFPNPIVSAWTEEEREDGTTIVCFGPPDVIDITDDEEVTKAIRTLIPDAEVIGATGYQWELDPFSKGTWCWYHPGQFGKSFKELRRAEDRLFFASADSAAGWRGFIDGAIESGIRVAHEVKGFLK